jgi:predicted RecA/RadA family phage recombinase
MAKNFVQEGETLDLAAPYARSAGQGALFGSLFAVALSDVANGATGAFKPCGVWDLAKNSAEAWTVGAKIYWNNTDKNCTTTSSGNTLIGCAVAVAANPSSTGRVRLNEAVA